jgi:hypothetical protein
MALTSFRIKKFPVLSIVKFMALIGFVWGFLAGIFLLGTYIWGYTTNGDSALILSGLYGFGLMILSGIIGGALGGALAAVLYNRVLGAKHGIRMELEPGS